MTVSVGDEKDSATEGTDYTAVDDFTVTITAGETSGEGTFTLTPENDNLIESNEAITLSGEVTAPAGSKLTVTDTEVTLTDDDLAQLPEPLKLAPVSLSADPSTVAEDAGVTKVKVTATVAQGMAFQEDRTVTVSVGESGDSATSGTDYKPVADFTITIKAEDSSGEYTFELTPTNDDVVEGDERITVSGTSQDIEVTGTQVTLADSDRAVVTVSDARAEEGEALTFTATLSGAVKVGVTVTPVYTDVTATMDVDYTASGEAVSFSGTAGETVSFAVPTVEDEIVELDETFMVGLTVSGAPPGVGTGEHGTGTIVNDDIAAASVADTSAEEGEVLVFTVTLDKAAAADGLVTMDYATEDGSARAGRDYTAVSGTLSFPAGETEATIEVETIDDALDEGEETLNLLLGRPVNAVLSDGSAVGTILNDDPLPTVWLTRCGRAAASHAADAVEARLHAEQAGSHLNLGGQTLAFGGEAADPAEVHGGGMRFGAAPEAESEDDLLDAESRAVTGRELAASSAFMLTQGGPAAAAGASRWTAWGSGASTHFEGYEGQLSLEGEVTGGTLGVDVERGEWTAGVAVSHNECTGTWNDSKSGHSGTVESPLTGVHPYLGWSDNRGLSLWGVAGLGQGELTVSPDGDERDYTTDIGMSMLALGRPPRAGVCGGGGRLRSRGALGRAGGVDGLGGGGGHAGDRRVGQPRAAGPGSGRELRPRGGSRRQPRALAGAGPAPRRRRRGERAGPGGGRRAALHRPGAWPDG